jgi:hypothetical protein
VDVGARVPKTDRPLLRPLANPLLPLVPLLALWAGPACMDPDDSGSGPPETVTCPLAADDPLVEPVETKCDLVDNDCDLQVDVLLPVEANRCTTGLPGACGHGYAACLDGLRICLAPPPVAEVWDGVDNDCNGVVDDVPPAPAGDLKAAVIIPPYIWGEAPEVVEEISLALSQVGIPYELSAAGPDWATALVGLERGRLAILPGYVIDESLTAAQVARLDAFVRDGGVLVVVKLINVSDAHPLLDLAGVASAHEVAGIAGITVDPAPATLFLDSLEERRIRLADATQAPDLKVWLYDLAAGAGATVFGTATRVDGGEAGAIGVARTVGKGRVYTLGHGLGSYPSSRCYLNCYDPGRDLLAMFLKGAFREACGGHAVVKHTLPGSQSGVLVLTHDVDAPDSHNPGTWGDAGAIQMARTEQERGVRGTYFVTTDYATGYYNPDMVQGLCDLGMCPEGAHSVLHAEMKDMVDGDCAVTPQTYDTDHPTTCGEVRVSMALLAREMPPGQPMEAWRSPFLEIAPGLYPILEDQGVRFSSSFATGDLRTHFPLPLARAWWDPIFSGLDSLYEFPINLEDGIGTIVNGVEDREELRGSNFPWFLASWKYIALQNAANGAWNVLLVHPSWGRGVGPENLPNKFAAVARMIEFAQQNDLLVAPLSELGRFQQGRDGVALEARWEDGAGYAGTLHVGALPAPEFTLEFGDAIAEFHCIGGGLHTVVGRHVTFTNPLPAGSTVTFTATVDRTPVPPVR